MPGPGVVPPGGRLPLEERRETDHPVRHADHVQLGGRRNALRRPEGGDEPNYRPGDDDPHQCPAAERGRGRDHPGVDGEPSNDQCEQGQVSGAARPGNLPPAAGLVAPGRGRVCRHTISRHHDPTAAAAACLRCLPKACPYARLDRQLAWRAEYRPLPASSRSGGPSSTISPPLITSTRSAIATVDRRCAIISAVRPARIVRSAACTARSLGRSSSEVASSSTSTAGAARKTRANETSWRWPADSRPPRLPTSAS